MDINDIRSAVTLFSFLCFIWLMGWVWAKHRRSAYDEAARLPLLENDGEPQ
jgi:cytochrome c oxidase cbb3-type subunit 4